MDKKTQAAIDGIYYGTLADKIKRNIKYITTGAAIGAVAGIITASLMGKCKLCFAFWGALGGVGVGYITAPKKQKMSAAGENYNCCI